MTVARATVTPTGPGGVATSRSPGTPRALAAPQQRGVRAILAAVAAALACSLAACGSTAPAPDKPAATGELADSCTTADDCTLVDACCGCNAGGQKLAIRKDAAAAFEASRPQRCGERMCAQFISQDPTCDAEATCGSRNRCRVAPHMQHQ